MFKVAFIRGKYLNNFEGQNYLLKDIKLTGISSLFPLNRSYPFPVLKFPSLADLPFFTREIKYLANRLLGDTQILYGLERIAGKFDIYHTADPHYYYSYQLAKLRQKNLIKKLLVTAWETIPFNNESVGKKRENKHFVLKQADYFLCYTVKAKNALIKEGVGESKIEVIRLGVDIDRFKRPVQGVGHKRELTILFVGRLVEEKGITDLYEAFKLIQRSRLKVKNHNLKLKIIGEGHLLDKLKYLINSDGLNDSVFIGKSKYNKMPENYRSADIFVLPSKKSKTWEEQYGLVLVEAMASGLPVAAYDSGAIAEVVGNAGMLIKSGDVRSLTAALRRLCETRELREKLGRMGRVRAEDYFDSKKTAQNLKKLYIKIYS